MFAMSLILQKIEIYDIFGTSKEEGVKYGTRTNKTRKISQM